jgi:hypothetical protein
VIQIASAMDSSSKCNSATSLQRIRVREDGYGNRVLDKAVFECTSRRPKLELLSVIPAGDKVKPIDIPKRTGPLSGDPC